MKNFALKGTILYSQSPDKLAVLPRGYAVCQDGVCRGVYPVLPEKYQTFEVKDWGDCLIIPGMTDLHVHAPQYTVCGYAMDLELMAWLEAYIFPEEARYASLEYAKAAYAVFVNDLVHSPTTRVCAFGTLHTEGTLELMRQLEEAGFCGLCGKSQHGPERAGKSV